MARLAPEPLQRDGVQRSGETRENGQRPTTGEDRRCLQSIATDCAGAPVTEVCLKQRPASARVGRLRRILPGRLDVQSNASMGAGGYRDTHGNRLLSALAVTLPFR